MGNGGRGGGVDGGLKLEWQYAHAHAKPKSLCAEQSRPRVSTLSVANRTWTVVQCWLMASFT